MSSISIIIRCKNEEEAIGRTLEKIFAQEIDISYEVVLVDSGSTDRTLGIAQQYPVRLFQIPPESFSFGYALNFGIEKAEGDIIVNISAHCIPCDDSWLSELVNPILEGNAHAAYGRQVPAEGINPFEEVFLDKRFPGQEKISGRVPFSNANCAFVRKMWDEVKFDEQISSWEDYLWYLLTKDRFVFRYTPNARVIHSHPFSVKRMARIAYQDGKAFRSMRERYKLDILADKSSVAGKLRYAIKDMLSHAIFFVRQGYFGAALMLPFLKVYSYLNYWRGYISSVTDK
jgi:glycosyltransferase involved in cell wall biosynthesis